MAKAWFSRFFYGLADMIRFAQPETHEKPKPSLDLAFKFHYERQAG